MTSRPLLILLVASAACARQQPLRELVTPQSHLGLGEGFGPGIVAASTRSMTYTLDTAAYVIVLRVMEDGAIVQLQPSAPGGDRKRHRGTYSITAAAARPYTPDAPHVPGGIVYGPCVSTFDTEVTRPDPACWTADRASAGPEARPLPSREREQEAGYWLVITSDAATSAAALDARLRALDLEDGTLLDTVRQIPGALVGGRTTNWAAYYVGFATLPAEIKR